MAGSLSNAKFLTGLVAKAATRGFSTTVEKGTLTRVLPSMVKKNGEDIAVKSPEKVAWVPDPGTGFYRPENVVQKIDVAELRAALLKKN